MAINRFGEDKGSQFTMLRVDLDLVETRCQIYLREDTSLRSAIQEDVNTGKGESILLSEGVQITKVNAKTKAFFPDLSELII